VHVDFDESKVSVEQSQDALLEEELGQTGAAECWWKPPHHRECDGLAPARWVGSDTVLQEHDIRAYPDRRCPALHRDSDIDGFERPDMIDYRHPVGAA
jgi:hypothetical protein